MTEIIILGLVLIFGRSIYKYVYIGYLKKKQNKYYEEGMAHFKEANDILKKSLKERGIKDRFEDL